MTETDDTLLNMTDAERTFLRDIKVFERVQTVNLIRIFYGFQFTILSMLVAFPAAQAEFALPYVGFCILVDVCRILLIKSVRVAVLTPQRVYELGSKKFDDSYRLDYIGVGFLFFYLFSPLFAHFLGAISQASSLTKYASQFFFISYAHCVFTYGFSSQSYKNFSLSYILVVTLIDTAFVAFVCTKGILLFDVKSILKSKRLNVPNRAHPTNVTRVCVMLLVFVGGFWALQLLLGPVENKTIPNSYDWAGPFPMGLYGVAKYAIISAFLSLDRFYMLSLQSFYLLHNEKS